MSAEPAAERDRVIARAPGKLFVAGEYAVVHGAPALLVAVDRCLTVQVAPSAQPARLNGRSWAYVGAAADVVAEVAGALGRETRPFGIATSSSLEDGGAGGRRKYGLGSSAAATVATVAALGRWHGLGLGAADVLRLALLATVRVNPAASGGDVAAAVLGGWVHYVPVDRDWLAERSHRPAAEVLAQEWPGLAAERLTAPSSFALAVGWTGSPAATVGQVASVAAGGGPSASFLAGSREVVAALRTAVLDDDAPAAVAAVRRARGLLQGLAAASGALIETPALAALADAAERFGWAGKSSGAGGGDCGIAVVPRGQSVTELVQAWETHGVTPLMLWLGEAVSVRGGAG